MKIKCMDIRWVIKINPELFVRRKDGYGYSFCGIFKHLIRDDKHLYRGECCEKQPGDLIAVGGNKMCHLEHDLLKLVNEMEKIQNGIGNKFMFCYLKWIGNKGKKDD